MRIKKIAFLLVFGILTGSAVQAQNAKQSTISEAPTGSQVLLVINNKTWGFLGDKNVEKIIDVSTIKSMNVLKGSSATSKYGDKGKHGVIEVITKDYQPADPKQAQNTKTTKD